MRRVFFMALLLSGCGFIHRENQMVASESAKEWWDGISSKDLIEEKGVPDKRMVTDKVAGTEAWEYIEACPRRAMISIGRRNSKTNYNGRPMCGYTFVLQNGVVVDMKQHRK